MYGDTTAAFIKHLKSNGPQTVKQLSTLSFWGGVRSRIGVLITQRRVERVRIANPDPYILSRIVVTAYKAVDGASEAYIPRAKSGRETYRERTQREKNERAVAKAISLLERRGYKVTACASHDARAQD